MCKGPEIGKSMGKLEGFKLRAQDMGTRVSSTSGELAGARHTAEPHSQAVTWN